MTNGKRRLLSLVVLLVVGAVGTASAQNVLTNGDFETGDFTGWTVFGVSAGSNASVLTGDNGPTLPGTHYVYLDNQAEAVGLGLKQTTAPGTAAEGMVEYSFDLKLDQADLGGVLFVEIFAEGEGLGIVGGSGLIGPLWPWEWTTYTGSFMAPANTSFLTIQIVPTTGATVGSNCIVRADNVILEQPGVVATEGTDWSSLKAQYR